MEVLTQPDSLAAVAAGARWPLPQRIAFRFCVVYFGLFCLVSQIISSVLVIPKLDVPDWGTLAPVRLVVFWVAAHLFHQKTPLVYSGSGSGDKVYDWVLLFCVLVASVVAVAVWSALDRKRTAYPALYKWFWLFLRFCLAGQMLTYGFIKAFPLQMPYPFLSRLIERFGDMSPMGVLWWSVGAAPGYETFAGCAELLGGLLLIFPRTMTLGALIALVDMTQVFVLNMTYDVPVKLLSFHLILIAGLLLLPEMRRLADFFFFNRTAAPSALTPLFEGQRARRIAGGIIAFLWIWMIGNNLYGAWDNWHQYGPAAAKSPLYGIWKIQDATVDGKPVPMLATDAQMWRTIVFEFPKYTEIECMDDSHGYSSAVDEKARTIILTDRRNKSWQARFAYTRPAFDRLTLDGTAAGHHETLHLARFDEKKFMLESRGFHWVQDYPFNR
jgi:uncharacterized membrane protein YphA (DoxX/SURF4 family)